MPPTEIIRAERINVRDVSTNSATLQWRPVLSGLTGYYEVRFGPLPTGGTGGGGGGGTGTSPSTSGGQYQRLIQSADSSTARLTGLKPDTMYTATLTPESNEQSFNALSVTFRTKPGWVTSYLHIVSCTHIIFSYSLMLFFVFPQTRGNEPSCSIDLSVRGNQRSSELGSSSAGDGHKLLHRVLRLAQGRAPHYHSGPNEKLHAPQRPPTRYHLLGHRYCPICLRHGESHVCQSVHSGR